MQACLSGFEALMVPVVLESSLACVAVCCWGHCWTQASALGCYGKAAAGREATGSRHSSCSVYWGERGPQTNPLGYPGLNRQQPNSFKLSTCGPLSPLLAWWVVRRVFPSARAVCEFCNMCGGLKATISHEGTVLVSGDMGILRGFCTHACKAALGNNCCMQHAISGNLPSSAVMFFDLPWFSDSKLPFPSLFRLVHSVFFPFLLSVYSVTLGKTVPCLSVVPSFTQRPSRPVWDCFEWKKKNTLTVNMWVLDQDDPSICSCTTEEGSAVRISQSAVLLKGLWELVWPRSLPRSGHWMTMRFSQWQEMFWSVSG